MCGIAGIVAPLSADEAQERLQAMLGQIVYRGPDECTGAVGDGFAIGTARLSIVDLVDRHPACDLRRRQDLCRLQRRDLQLPRFAHRSLAAKGHTFRSNSEVEVLLHLYQEHGPAMARMLNGQFAVAIWDAGARALHLFRDPFGIRPLFWWSDGRSIIFASEIKALLANREISVTLDARALIQTLRFWTVVGDRTMFCEIKQVPPGHTLSWREGRTSLERYWDWPFSSSVEPLQLKSDAEYFEAFHDAFGTER